MDIAKEQSTLNQKQCAVLSKNKPKSPTGRKNCTATFTFIIKNNNMNYLLFLNNYYHHLYLFILIIIIFQLMPAFLYRSPVFYNCLFKVNVNI
jgi:hypothetical protein